MEKTKLLGLALVATMTGASFSACSNETEEVLAQESEIRLTSEITPSRVTSLDYQSTQIVEGQQVGVTITGASSEHNNVAWAATTDGALTNGGDAVYYGSGEATITAYHPYNSSWTGTSHTFSVSTDQSSEAGYLASDLLWATTTSSKTTDAVGLTFAHKLAKIDVTLTSDDITDLSNATISICGTNIATNVNPSTGELSAASTANVADIKVGVTTSSAKTAAAIIIPQTIASGTKFIKVVHNSKTFYYTLSANKEFAGGKSYSYNLNVKEALVEVSASENITNWVDGDTEANTGNAEEEAFTMTAVDLGLSVKWAYCNLGAETKLEMGDRYAWGETSSKSTFTKENYAYYNTDGTYQDLGDDISGTEFDAATTILGKGWRMPTKAEWEELKSNCTATSYEIDGSSFYYAFRSNRNNNVIHIPATYSSYYYWTSTDYTYSSASLSDDNENIAPYYFMLNFDYTEIKERLNPYQGCYIRAVYDGE